MKILYLVDVDLDKTSGVSSKVCMQAMHWQKEGHKVILLSIYSLSFFNTEGVRLSEAKIIRKNKGKLSFIINAYKSSIQLKSLIADVEFDIVYMRYRIYDFFFKSAVQHKPIISEMNTVYEMETKLRSKASYIYYTLFKRLSFNTIEGFVCVSNEIRDITVDKKQYKSIVIANGINLDNTSCYEQTNSLRPKIVFIGSPNQLWAGVDKIKYLATVLKCYDFYIIGENGTNTENLIYCGYLSMEEASKIIKVSDVGICTLALHRKFMHEASPLKSRQYLAFGLPIIYAYEDTDIKNDFPFALKLSNDEDNIKNNIDIIRGFINQVFHSKTIRLMARDFAISNLDANLKENTRLKFIEKILSENR